LVTPEADGNTLKPPAANPFVFNFFPTELASSLRDSMLYLTQGAPLNEPPDPSGTYDEYESIRTAAGWRTVRRLTPNGAQAVFPGLGGTDANHSYTFTQVLPVAGTRDGGSLAEDGAAVYLGSPDGSFELLGVGSLGIDRLARGWFISPGGEHIIFSTGTELCVLYGEPCTLTQLEPNAPPTGTPAVYDRNPDGPTQVVSLLPGDVTPAAGEAAEYQGASADGSVVAFKVADVLYVRVDNSSTIEVVGPGSTFAGLDQNGDAIFYLNGGNLYRFAIPSETIEQINAAGAEVLAEPEVVNVSADGSHVYFLSLSQLGSEGSAGEPNLYVWSVGGGIQFVATVSFADLGGEPGLNNWTSRFVKPDNELVTGPGASSARTTPDGRVIAFESRAQLTPYNNEGSREVYRWDEGTGSLLCASCNPLTVPPSSDVRFEEVAFMSPAAVIHNLSADGSKIFFETSEKLAARDTDGLNDIYEWRADGEGEEPSINLISSGQTGQTFRPVNLIFGITSTGNDVIFSSLDQLVPSAGVNGIPALYDARVNGGFAEPLPESCVGEACRSTNQGPTLSTAQTNAFFGKGNVRRRKHRCHRNKHRHGKKHKTPCRHHKKGGSR
jgi:hypothetical protein